MSLEIIYDGDCPFCSRFVALQKLRETFGEVTIVDARMSSDPSVQKVISAGYILNDGMAVIFNGEIFYGVKSVEFLAMATSGGAFGFLMKIFFTHAPISRLFYSVLVKLRKIYLKIVGFDDLKY